MDTVFKIFLSMSCSGGLLALALLCGKPFFRNKLSRQWQYYIWLVVLLRLLLPFGPETSLLGKTYQTLDRAVAQAAPLPRQLPPDTQGGGSVPAGLERDGENAGSSAEETAAARTVWGITPALTGRVWMLWLAVALGLLIRKATAYQSFIRYIRAGLVPVSDTGLLDRLSTAAEQAGVKKPVELCLNPLVSSPMLIGFFHPCIVLPSGDIPEKNVRYIVLHELTHYRRRDMLYKWLVQVTVCLHWFNPLVHLMSREITKACEFSCDEAVLARAGYCGARDYGKTLLDAMAAVGAYREHFGAVTLSENKQLLKERLDAIMKVKKQSPALGLLTGVLTLCMVFGAVFVGVYPAAACRRDYAARAERYYEAGSLPLFQIVFSRLDESAQEKWLETFYEDGEFVFFSVAVRGLDANSTLPADFAEKAYADEETAFFSTLTDCMEDAELELWLDRALKDENWTVQSMLFDKLDRDDEFDKLEEKREKEREEAQAAEYRAAGVTMDGKDYYYQGQLVRIFLDIRPNKSFYTLNMNPSGTVNIKIVRNETNEITGAAYMTEAEAAELLGDMEDPEADTETTPVDWKTAAAGETIFLGEYILSDGDKICYDISAGTGAGMQVFFTRDGQENVVYWSVHNLRQPGEPLRCAADFTVAPPAEPGAYQMFLRAADGPLGDIKGSISIAVDPV